jgi:hypothetical protein
VVPYNSVLPELELEPEPKLVFWVEYDCEKGCAESESMVIL